MDYEKIKAAVAPCGLSCEKCFAHMDGEIRRLSRELKERLGNFGPYAKRFETLLDAPVFAKYADFAEMLDFLAAGQCKGCRNEQCKLFAGCGVRRCHQEKRVDFCHQCDEFPCGNTQFDESLHKAWLSINEIIRKKGLDQYLELTRNRPRYV